MNENEIEEEITSKGLNAPRVSPKLIDNIIMTEQYFVFNGILTVCCLTLENGFNVIGESSCSSPKNYDVMLGQTLAKENAKNKIWMLEGYILKQAIYDDVIPAKYIQLKNGE